jgi:hypothetical protein
VRNRVKRRRPCTCTPQVPPAGAVMQPCHWGNCTEWRCPACRGLVFSAGEIWCRCDGGCYRAFRHPGMENGSQAWDEEKGELTYYHVAVKPSKARRFQGGKHNR